MEKALGNTQSAEARYQQGLVIAERLAAGAPENVQFARDLRFSYDYLGHKERALGDSQAALARYQQSLAITERLASRPPQDDQDASNLSTRYRKLGDMEQALGNGQAALARYQQGLLIAERLAAGAPENAKFARDLSISYEKLGDMEQALGNSQAALARHQQALVIRERLAVGAAESVQFAIDLQLADESVLQIIDRARLGAQEGVQLSTHALVHMLLGEAGNAPLGLDLATQELARYINCGDRHRGLRLCQHLRRFVGDLEFDQSIELWASFIGFAEAAFECIRGELEVAPTTT